MTRVLDVDRAGPATLPVTRRLPEPVRRWLAQEPAVIIVAVAGVVAAAATEVTAGLQPGDGWRAAGLALAAFVLRRFVISPATAGRLVVEAGPGTTHLRRN